tara:strand:- start:714 stop:977 length:264 start_codon:yes stop_codon:yes gene_type:complete
VLTGEFRELPGNFLRRLLYFYSDLSQTFQLLGQVHSSKLLTPFKHYVPSFTRGIDLQNSTVGAWDIHRESTFAMTAINDVTIKNSSI